MGSSSTSTTAITTYGGGGGNKKKPWSNHRPVAATPAYKGAIVELSNKIFITGHQQAIKYDDAHKVLLLYINSNFNHRVHLAFERKDAAAGLALLSKSKAPKKPVVVQEEDPTDRSKTILVTKQEIDKDSEDFYEY